MFTFIDSVKDTFKNSTFAVEPLDLMVVHEIRSIYEDGKSLKERKEYFKTINKVCRLMVSGPDDTEAHYQVLLMDRDNKEIILIEHSQEEVMDNDQHEKIRNALDSMGWTQEWDTIKFLKMPKTKKKKKTKSSDFTWHIKHIVHFNPSASNQLQELGDINQNNNTYPDCGDFSFIVFLKYMSSTDSFEAKNFKFDSDGPSSVAIGKEGIRWDAIKNFVNEQFHTSKKIIKI